MEEFLGNTHSIFSEGSFRSWLVVFASALVASFLARMMLKAIASYLRKFTQRTISIWDDVAVDLVDGTKVGVLFAAFFFLVAGSVPQSERTHKFLLTLVIIAISFQITIWGLYLIKNWYKEFLGKRVEKDPSSSAAIGLLYTGIRVGFLVLIVLIGLSNLGIDITALIAGLGVGGIAVALAAQNILGDLLASLSIVLDKPFVVGDFIVAGSEKGTVEQVGIKTTRLRSLSGEQLVLSNKDLLESRVQNFKRMWTRRVVQSFGVVYSTTADRLEKIPVWVKEIVAKQPKLVFDRCHFMGYGDSSLNFELVFFVSDPEYNVYMDLQQQVLLDIFRRFAAEKIDFAFPTQTLHVESFSSSPPAIAAVQGNS